MTSEPVLVAAATALASYLCWRPVPVTFPVTPEQRGRSASPAAEAALLTRLRWPLCLLAFVGGWTFVGGVPGAVAGVAAAVASWVVLGRTESPAVRRRRERLAHDLPVGVDLFGACLAAGSAPETALLMVADALPGPVAEEFAVIHHRLMLGVDVSTVWAEVSRHPQLGPLGRAVSRAHDTGASVAEAVHRLAGELRSRTRAEVEQRAKSVDVKAAAPLGVCFLPAFLLLGVVPMVVGLFTSMDLFG